MENQWKIHGKSMKNQWKINGKSMRKSISQEKIDFHEKIDFQEKIDFHKKRDLRGIDQFCISIEHIEPGLESPA